MITCNGSARTLKSDEYFGDGETENGTEGEDKSLWDDKSEKEVEVFEENEVGKEAEGEEVMERIVEKVEYGRTCNFPEDDVYVDNLPPIGSPCYEARAPFPIGLQETGKR
mgnify:CR=1 FL=1